MILVLVGQEKSIKIAAENNYSINPNNFAKM